MLSIWRFSFVAVTCVGLWWPLDALRLKHSKGTNVYPSDITVEEDDADIAALLEVTESTQVETTSWCLLYPVLEKKFGSPVRFAGHEMVKCLGRGTAGEVWLMKDAVMKIQYYSWDGGNQSLAKYECEFAKGVHSRDPRHFVDCLDIGVQEVDIPRNSWSLPSRLRSSSSSNLKVHYAIQGLAPGDDLQKAICNPEMYPTLDDAFKLGLDMAEIADRMMTPTEEDPSEYYYWDLHLWNIKVSSDKQLKLVDYGQTYMCCNHGFSNATSKCGHLPKCNQTKQRTYRANTVNFVFANLLFILTGGGWCGNPFRTITSGMPSDVLDYFALPHAFPPNTQGSRIFGSQRKALQDLTPAATVATNFRSSVKKPYILEWADLGDASSSIVAAGLQQCASTLPSQLDPLISSLKSGRDKLKSGKTQRCTRAVAGAVPRNTALDHDKVFCKCPQGMLPTGAQCRSPSRKFDPSGYVGKGCQCREPKQFCAMAVAGAVPRDTALDRLDYDKELCKCPRGMLPTGAECGSAHRKFDPNTYAGKGCRCEESEGSH
jgi:hypothetical protein